MLRQPLLIPNTPQMIKPPVEVIKELLALNHQLILNLNQAKATIVDQSHKLKIKDAIIRAQSQRLSDAKLANDQLQVSKTISQQIRTKQSERVTQLKEEIKKLQDKVVELEKNRQSNPQEAYLLMQPLTENSLFSNRKVRFAKTKKISSVPLTIRFL